MPKGKRNRAKRAEEKSYSDKQMKKSTILTNKWAIAASVAAIIGVIATIIFGLYNMHPDTLPSAAENFQSGDGNVQADINDSENTIIGDNNAINDNRSYSNYFDYPPVAEYYPQDDHYNEAQEHFERTEYSEALEDIEKSRYLKKDYENDSDYRMLTEIEQARFNLHSANVHTLMGNILLSLGDVKNAKDSWLVALGKFRLPNMAPHTEERNISELHHAVACAFYETGEYPKAIAEEELALEKLQANIDEIVRDEVITNIYNTMGNCYQMMGFHQSLDYFKQAIEYYVRAILPYMGDSFISPFGSVDEYSDYGVVKFVGDNVPNDLIDFVRNVGNYRMITISPVHVEDVKDFSENMLPILEERDSTKNLNLVPLTLAMSPDFLVEELTNREREILSLAYGNLAQLYDIPPFALDETNSTNPDIWNELRQFNTSAIISDYAIEVGEGLPLYSKELLLLAYSNWFMGTLFNSSSYEYFNARFPKYHEDAALIARSINLSPGYMSMYCELLNSASMLYTDSEKSNDCLFESIYLSSKNRDGTNVHNALSNLKIHYTKEHPISTFFGGFEGWVRSELERRYLN
jgi:tetratricopeptide (TPR) repeat protein